ncbi:cupin domain-containing protein [Pseudomonas sp. NPDC087358]|uniref:cupin domain-containing protein n=1 Tax=Pseudomonas sp. NPDC087358 TaxID=3364439 RepID=UPI003851152C
MSIEQIRTIGDHCTAVTPSTADYDGVSSTWTETEYRAFDLPGGSFGGYWRGAPGDVYFRSWPYNETCVLTLGRIALEDASGRRIEFTKGDAFYIPAGFEGRWITLEPTEKYFIAIAG